MKHYLIGFATIPAIYLAWTIFILLFRTTRDTYRTLRGAELKEGYSRWNWIPATFHCFWRRFKDQCWSMWNGIYTEVQ